MILTLLTKRSRNQRRDYSGRDGAGVYQDEVDLHTLLHSFVGPLVRRTFRINELRVLTNDSAFAIENVVATFEMFW